MPIFYGRGRVAGAIELSASDLGGELKPAASALSVACRSLSRQLATEFGMMWGGFEITGPDPVLRNVIRPRDGPGSNFGSSCAQASLPRSVATQTNAGTPGLGRRRS